ncbi:LacI family DNA-binding transcriptional regulator [Treponema sp.]
MPKASHRVTVYDLAQELGLSTSTVSRALDESDLIGADTRSIVLAAAKRLGYTRRTIRRPQSRSIMTIKLYIPESRDAYVHLFYDLAELIDGIQRGFGEVRLNIVTSLNDGSDTDFTAKKTGNVDASVFAFTEADPKLFARYTERGVPLIHINRVHPERNYVAVDNYLGMETLLRRVVDLRGKVKPCYIGFSAVAYISRERRAGLLGAASKLGITLGTEDCFEFDSIPALGGDFVRSLPKRGYDAVFCFNDLLAVHVYNRALREGLDVPRDFALTGFDNAPVLDLAPRRIDTIEFSIRELGQRTGTWLKRRLIDRSEDDIRMTLAGGYVRGETIGAIR